MKIKISQNLKQLSEIFAPYAKLLIVGGYVRNSLLGFTATDVDLASKLTPEKITSLLKGTKFEIVSKNVQVGYVKIRADDELYEHTTFRKDNYYPNGTHRVQSVSFVEDLRQDAMRRDFTINSIYYDIENEKIIDIYSGLLDLKNSIVRTVEVPGYVLAHDGTRILRMIRLASELNFKIDFATLATAKKYAHLLHNVSPAQKYKELMAILNSPKKYPISKKKAHLYGLSFFNQLRLWNSFFITISRVKFKMLGSVQQKDVFFGFLIDVIDSVNPDCIEYYLKDLLGKNGFGLGAGTINDINNIICGYYDAINKMNNKYYFFKYYDCFEDIADLLQARSKKIYNKYKFFYSYINKHNLPVHLKELKISGADLAKQIPELNEKKYSTVLTNLLSEVFDGKVINEKPSLIKEVKNDIANNRY